MFQTVSAMCAVGIVLLKSVLMHQVLIFNIDRQIPLCFVSTFVFVEGGGGGGGGVLNKQKR